MFMSMCRSIGRKFKKKYRKFGQIDISENDQVITKSHSIKYNKKCEPEMY